MIQYRLSSREVQNYVQNFTMSGRFWTAFPIDRVEYILHFFHVLPIGYSYVTFDPRTEELIWIENGVSRADDLEYEVQKRLVASNSDEEVTKLQKFIAEKTDP